MAYLPMPSAETGRAAALNMGKAPGAAVFGDCPCAALFPAFIVAHSARAGVAQEYEVVVRAVAVVPLDVHARAGGQAHFHRLGIGGGAGGLERGLHGSSIA